MRVVSNDDRIIHLHADTQFELCYTFLRPQEFYEGEFDEIRGKVFTLDQFIELYSNQHGGKFTYLTDWGGFNIPSNIYERFLRKFELASEERAMSELVDSCKPDGKYYIIGTYGMGSALDHEIAHAKYYLVDEYKEQVDSITKSLPEDMFSTVKQYLLNTGYCENVIRDEIQAYVGTSSKDYLDTIHPGLSSHSYRYKQIIKDHA